jgi:hypothetical protein
MAAPCLRENNHRSLCTQTGDDWRLMLRWKLKRLYVCCVRRTVTLYCTFAAGDEMHGGPARLHDVLAQATKRTVGAREGPPYNIARLRHKTKRTTLSMLAVGGEMYSVHLRRATKRTLYVGGGRPNVQCTFAAGDETYTVRWRRAAKRTADVCGR